MFNKRGGAIDEQFDKIYQGLIALIVFLTLYFFVVSFNENLRFDREYIVRDIALTLDSLYAFPGNVNYIYTYTNSDTENDLNNFTIYFDHRQLDANTVGAAAIFGSSEGIISGYPYATDTKMRTSLNTQSQKDTLVFLKSGDVLTNYEDLHFNRLLCKPTSLTKKRPIMIQFTPGHEFMITLATILPEIGDPSWLYSHTLSGSSFTPTGNSGNLNIILKAVDAEENYVKVFYHFPSEEGAHARQFTGCQIANSLLDGGTTNFPLALIPASLSTFEPLKTGELYLIEFGVKQISREQILSMLKELVQQVRSYG